MVVGIVISRVDCARGWISPHRFDQRETGSPDLNLAVNGQPGDRREGPGVECFQDCAGRNVYFVNLAAGIARGPERRAVAVERHGEQALFRIDRKFVEAGGGVGHYDRPSRTESICIQAACRQHFAVLTNTGGVAGRGQTGGKVGLLGGRDDIVGENLRAFRGIQQGALIGGQIDPIGTTIFEARRVGREQRAVGIPLLQ